MDTLVKINKLCMRKSVNIFLTISLSKCFRRSREQSVLGGTYEHKQHMFWFRNEKKNYF